MPEGIAILYALAADAVWTESMWTFVIDVGSDWIGKNIQVHSRPCDCVVNMLQTEKYLCVVAEDKFG